MSNIEYQTETNIQSVNVRIHGCCDKTCSLPHRMIAIRVHLYICTTQIQHADRAENV